MSVFTRGKIVQAVDGAYQVGELIDRGGVGTVYRAQRVADRVPVALKVLHGGRFPITDAAVERFRREIDVALRLDHPNLVKCLDFGICDDTDFMVMEYLEGGTVGQRIRRADYDDSTAFLWCHQLIEAVLYLHSQGCIHRDLKPNNLLLSAAGSLEVGDLGIVRDTTADAYLTLAGDQVGSVLYISQHQRDQPDCADEGDDAYAVCSCLYEILSRRRIRVLPESLHRLAPDRLPVYVIDLIMGGLSGEGGVKTLDLLSRCFAACGGAGGLTDEARSFILNRSIEVMPDVANPGVARHAISTSVPLGGGVAGWNLDVHFGGDGMGGKDYAGLSFMGESTVMLLEDSKEWGQPQRLIALSFEPGYLASTVSVPVRRTHLLASVGARVVVAGASGVHVFQIGSPSTPDIVADYRLRLIDVFPGLRQPDLGTIQLTCHPERPLALLGARAFSPRVLELASGRVVPFATIQKSYLGLAFVGEHHLALVDEAFVHLYEFSPDELESAPTLIAEVERPSYGLYSSDSVLQVSSSRLGKWIVVATDKQAECVDLESGKTNALFQWGDLPWLLSPVSAVSHPLLRYVALLFGLGADAALCAEVWSLDTKVRGKLVEFQADNSAQLLQHIGWSPTGSCLAIAGRGVIYYFSLNGE